MIRITRANYLRLAPQIVDLCVDAYSQRNPPLGIPLVVLELLATEFRHRDPEFAFSAENLASLLNGKTQRGVTVALSNLGLCGKSSAELASIHALALKNPYNACQKVAALAEQWLSSQPQQAEQSEDLQSERAAFNALPPAERQSLVDALYSAMRTLPLTIENWQQWQSTAMIYGLPVIHVDHLFQLGRSSLEVTPFVKLLASYSRGGPKPRQTVIDGTVSIRNFAKALYVHQRVISGLIEKGVLTPVVLPMHTNPRLKIEDLETARAELNLRPTTPAISKPSADPSLPSTITAEQLILPVEARTIRCLALHPDGSLPEAALAAFLTARSACFVSLSTVATCVFHRQVVERGGAPSLITPLERRGAVTAPYICAVLGEFGVTRPAVECLVIDGAFPTSQSDYALIHQALAAHPAQTVLFCTTPVAHWHASRYLQLVGLSLPDALEPADGDPASQVMLRCDQGIRLQSAGSDVPRVAIAIGPQLFYDQVLALIEDLQHHRQLAGVDPGLSRLASLVDLPMSVALPTPVSMEMLSSMNPVATRPTLIPTAEYLATLGPSAGLMAKGVDRLLSNTRPLQKRARIAPTNIVSRRLTIIAEYDPRGLLTMDQICDLALSTPSDLLEPVRSGLLGQVVRALVNRQPLQLEVSRLKEQLGTAPSSYPQLLCWLLNVAVRQPAILTPAQCAELAALVTTKVAHSVMPNRARGSVATLTA